MGRDASGMCDRSPGASHSQQNVLRYKCSSINKGKKTYGAWLLLGQLHAIVHFQGEIQTLVGLPEEVQLVEDLVVGLLVVELRLQEVLAAQAKAHKVMRRV